MNFNDVQKKIEAIKGDKMMTPNEIVDLGLVLNTKLQPSMFTVYRLIKSGKLPAANLGNGAVPRFMVKGSDLKKYLKERYNITTQS